MVYATLDGMGNVNGVYAQPQTGNATFTVLADNDPKVVLYLSAVGKVNISLESIGLANAASLASRRAAALAKTNPIASLQFTLKSKGLI